jgi:hypothetical protein
MVDYKANSTYLKAECGSHWIGRNGCLVTLLCLASLWPSGCSSPAPYEFDAMDLTPTQDEMIEFSLGHYAIPIPVVRPYEKGDVQSRNRVVFVFELYALIGRDFEAEMRGSWERHEGKIRDRVIRVCRTASLEDLQEPEFATLKAHLTDAVQSQLGRRGVRRLLMADVALREL